MKQIEVKNLSAGYGGAPVIRDINLIVDEKDFVGIIGPNGGGKSTFVKTLLGLIKPMGGEINFYENGVIADKIPMGYLPQRNNIDHNFPISVFDVVLSGLMNSRLLAGRIDKKQKVRVEEALSLTGMIDYKQRAIGSLSGGQMQRVMLSRAIISNPKALILDEPNSYIDKKFEAKLYELLAEINKNTTILMVSHEITSLVDMVTKTISIDETLKPADLSCPFHHDH
ncbi:MAG: ABC transporter ATP-binding protein [Bacteroidales bacterium]|nr:ABC transporter ATP-binding protein [Bacteroidales bacterium]